MEALEVLENIDDDLDRLNVAMVKVRQLLSRIKYFYKCLQIPEKDAFLDWGVTNLCSVFYFENGIPNIYSGIQKTHIFRTRNARNQCINSVTLKEMSVTTENC